MKKKKAMTVSAQDVKKGLLEIAGRIGRRKKIRAGEFFELMLEAMKK